MKVCVANFAHVDGSVDGRRDHDIIGSVDPGIGLCGVEQRLNHHQEAPPARAAKGRLEVDARIVDHLGERVVELGQLLVILGANMDPDNVQIDELAKPAQQGQYVFDAARIRRHVCAFGAGSQLRRRRDVEGKRNILRQIGSGIGKPMLTDESTNLFMRIARIC